MHRYRTHTCGALRDSDVGATSACRAGATASATMAASCSSICATITASPNAWSTRIRPPSGRPRRCARNGSSASTATVRRAPGRHREPRPADRCDRGLRDRRSRCSGPPPSCRCRCSASRSIRRRCGCATASSICAARSCTRTSCSRGEVIDSLRRRMKDERLLRVPDADPDRVQSRRRARLSRALAPASRASSTRCRRRRSSSSS